jgi:hypothetical protein
MKKPTLFNSAGRQWHYWFAWTPCWAFDDECDLRATWLRWVLRKSDEFFGYPGPNWDYRRISPKTLKLLNEDMSHTATVT